MTLLSWNAKYTSAMMPNTIRTAPKTSRHGLRAGRRIVSAVTAGAAGGDETIGAAWPDRASGASPAGSGIAVAPRRRERRAIASGVRAENRVENQLIWSALREAPRCKMHAIAR